MTSEVGLRDTPSKNRWQDRWMDRFYKRRSGWIGGTAEFHVLLSRAIPQGGKILEVGAGPTNRTTAHLASLGTVTGLDIDPEARENIHLAASAIYDGGEFPFESCSFDAVVSDFVLEHVANPAMHLREIARVLRPGGCFVFRTPNLYHYVSAFAAVTPHWVHEMLANRLRQLPDDQHPPYPTYHACNTERAVKIAAEQARLKIREMRLIEKEPSYGLSSRVLFVAFMAYERLVNSHSAFSGFRANILAVLTKEASG